MGHLLRKAEVETTTTAAYAAKVKESYSHGTYRCGPLLQLSLVGQVSEEAGRYFPEFLGEEGENRGWGGGGGGGGVLELDKRCETVWGGWEA